MTDVIRWLLDSDEPWTRYRTLVDLLDRPEGDPERARHFFYGPGFRCALPARQKAGDILRPGG